MRYAKYKPTGIAWLPEVPDGWEVKKVRQLAHEGKTKNKGNIETNVLSLSYGRIIRKKDIYAGLVPTDFATYQIIEPGNVILRLTDLQNDHRSLRCGLAKERGIITSAYVSIIPQNILPAYLYLALHTCDLHKVFYSMGGGLRQSMNFADVANIFIPVPPLPTQRAIVAFLDEKCGKVDRLVAAKEKEVALLKELKQSVIAEAVTGKGNKEEGKSNERRLVPSGIPWLPELPEGWEVRRAKYLFQKEQRPVQEGDEIVTCFRDGEVTLRKNRRLSGFTEATDYSHYQHICVGDLVIHQMDAFAGSCGVSDSDGMGTPVLSVCTPKNDQLDVRYFAAVIRLMGLNGFIQSLYRGIRERSSDFRFETFAKQLLPRPLIAEQREIVAYIDARSAKIDAAVAGLEKEIAALKEYKQRLIADVVTGQRRVEGGGETLSLGKTLGFSGEGA